MQPTCLCIQNGNSPCRRNLLDFWWALKCSTDSAVVSFAGEEPAKPDEDTASATLTRRLMANEKFVTHDAVTLTRALLTLRDRRQADMPEVLGIETPARDAPSLPVHLGTSQHLDAVYQDILARYTNLIFVPVKDGRVCERRIQRGCHGGNTRRGPKMLSRGATLYACGDENWLMCDSW
jgi:hypothetical protein